MAQEGSKKEIRDQSSSTYFGLTNVNNVRGSRYSDQAINMRDALMNYLNSEEGAVPWQKKNIRRTSYELV